MIVKDFANNIFVSPNKTPTWVTGALTVSFVFSVALIVFGASTLSGSSFLSQFRSVGTVGLGVITGTGALGLTSIALGPIVRHFLSKNRERAYKHTILEAALQNDDVKNFSEVYPTLFLSSQIKPFKETYLHRACTLRKNKIAKYLIKNHPNLLKVMNEEKNIPIFYAASDLKLVRMMLDKMPNLESAKNGDGSSSVARILIEFGTTEDFAKYIGLENWNDREKNLALQYHRADLYEAIEKMLLLKPVAD